MKQDSSSLFTTISIPSKKVNEDSATTFKNTKLNLHGVIIADGIGSHYKPEIGAEFCVNTLKEFLENCENHKELNLASFFRKVQEEMNRKLAEKKEENVEEEFFGTTLLCAVETEDKFLLSYVGNGSIWHLRGDFFKLIHSRRFLPWNAVNLLNPHTVEENGKSSLYNFFALGKKAEEITPSILSLEKDKYSGDIILLTTDGVFGNDQVNAGKDKEGTLWLSGYNKMEKLFLSLKNFAEKQEKSLDTLNQTMQNWKKEIETFLDDDATVGVIYSLKALNFSKTYNAQKDKNK